MIPLAWAILLFATLCSLSQAEKIIRLAGNSLADHVLDDYLCGTILFHLYESH